MSAPRPARAGRRRVRLDRQAAARGWDLMGGPPQLDALLERTTDAHPYRVGAVVGAFALLLVLSFAALAAVVAVEGHPPAPTASHSATPGRAR